MGKNDQPEEIINPVDILANYCKNSTENWNVSSSDVLIHLSYIMADKTKLLKTGSARVPQKQ